jgi:hypothetical protein
MAEGTFASLDGKAITATEVMVRAHLQACVYLEAELKARIEAAVTADEVSAMIWALAVIGRATHHLSEQAAWRTAERCLRAPR